MPWLRVLQMIDEDSNLGDDIVRRLYTPLCSKIPLTGNPAYLVQSLSETLKGSLHQIILSKNAVKSGLSSVKLSQLLSG